MTTFLGISLTKEEELIMTNIIIDMTTDDKKISNEDLLHELIGRSQSHDKLEMTKRELKKLRKRCKTKSNSDKLFLGKSQAYTEVLDILDESKEKIDELGK